jgi:hypothetical protein
MVTRFTENKSSKTIKKLLYDKNFKSRKIYGIKDFSHDRKLKFEELIIPINNGLVKSIHRELNTFFKEV